ncbi:methylenetetrahydrofolate reductase [Novosphingobium flavum]|uniref:Methylenetetrahydrofolate reductase n=1 Tax=Novosphingobium flavum TaxID=1778672 RepID=A0A7X1KLW8_9SPHN|nr:methylenetetrahydrofolate reductase [Novosphingobium flavum]MBC2666014.1 methylenetetrahydrofolate reductase [Novosphingobium flavum]
MIPLNQLFADYSIEATAKDAALLGALGKEPARPAEVFVPWLPEEGDAARIAACVAVRAQGFEPVPHISARRIESLEALDRLLGALRAEAGATRLFLIAGDLSRPSGPFSDSLSVIETGLIERHGFTSVGIAGHPDDHPDVPDEVLWQAMADKLAALKARGLAAQVVTQFSFDAQRVVSWLAEVRARGHHVPVRIGIPGPAGVRVLLRFATRCGVAASASAVAKYGLSLGRLLGDAGPDRFLVDLGKGLAAGGLGAVRLHVFPFGGFAKFAGWLGAALQEPERA